MFLRELHAIRTAARSREAFTLIEALVSISIAAIAGSALLMGVSSSLQTTTEAIQQTVAEGMAQQLMNEALGLPYHTPGSDGYDTTLGPSSYELGGTGRQRFDEIGDYNGLSNSPPTDLWGVELGTEDRYQKTRHPSFHAPEGFFSGWQQAVTVYYVDDLDPDRQLSLGQVSDHRAIDVRILRTAPDGTTRELARLRRVLEYVPQ